jgi:hypothetical protein
MEVMNEHSRLTLATSVGHTRRRAVGRPGVATRSREERGG